MYLDIEKQLDKITDGLEQELLSEKAIDESGRTINVEKFNQIIGEKIKQCNAVLETTEKDGVTKDLYGANIAYARINMLRKMKQFKTINPESNWNGKEEPAIDKLLSEKKRKTNAFNSGILKLVAMMKSVFKPSKTSEKNR